MKKEIGKLIIVTIILILVIVGSVSGTVLSQAKGKHPIEDKYYQQIEREYLKEVKETLTEDGYVNSGVTITKVINEDGSREYQVLIHNQKLEKLSEQSCVNLKDKLAQIYFPIDNCSFKHEFMESDI